MNKDYSRKEQLVQKVAARIADGDTYKSFILENKMMSPHGHETNI